MSLVDVLPRLPNIWRRIRQSVDAVIAQSPDALVILDSPEFTHQVAKRVRRRAPTSPSSTTSRRASGPGGQAGRARCAAIVDHILAILPFEPEAHRRLGGPACSYVGHPLVEKLDWMRNLDAEALRERLGIAKDRVVLVVLPGSRASEVKRLMAPFGDACAPAAGGGRALRGDPARGEERSPADRGGTQRLVDDAAYRERRGGQIRRLQARARGACRLRHRDARAGARRHADGRRLPGRPDREQLALSADRPFGGAAQSHPRRKRLPRASESGVRRREVERGAVAAHAGRP